MAYPLKLSTAATVVLGPFLDDTDGKTAETANIAAASILLHKKDGTTVAAKDDTSVGTHRANGMVTTSLNATDTNTIGPLVVEVHVAGALPVRLECAVMSASAYNFMYGATALPVDVTKWNGATAPANTGDAFARLGAPSGASIAADIAALVTTVAAGIPTFEPIDSFTMVAGTARTGNVASLNAHDGIYLEIGENATTGLEVIATATASPVTDSIPLLIEWNGRYNANTAAHLMTVAPWNYVTAAWETNAAHIATMIGRTTDFGYSMPLNNEHQHPTTGEMKVRFLHNVATYNATHYLALDSLRISKVATTNAMAQQVAAILSLTQGIDNDVDIMPLSVWAAAQEIAGVDMENTMGALVNKGYRESYNTLDSLTGSHGGTVTAANLIADIITTLLATENSALDISKIGGQLNQAHLRADAGANYAQTIDSIVRSATYGNSALKTAVTAVSTKLGTPVTSVSADIASLPLAVEGRLLNETDGQALLAAIVTAINAADVDVAGLSVVAIATEVLNRLLVTPANKIATDATGRVTPDTVTPETDVSGIAADVVSIQDLLEADITVNNSTLTMTWKHKDTGVVLLTKPYMDSGPVQSIG